MSRIRALAKESLVYGVSSIVSRFLNFLLVPFYTHVLSTSEFGISNIIFAIVAFLNVVYQFGFDSAYLRLAADATGLERKKLFTTAFISQALGCILFSVLLLALAGPLGQVFLIPTENRMLLAFAAGILILDTLTVVPFAHLRLEHAALRFALMRLGNVVLNIAANWLFVLHWHKGLEGVFWANLVASAGTLIMALPVLVANLRPVFDRPAFRQLLKFGLPLVPAGLYGIVNEMAGRLCLGFLKQTDIDRLYPDRGYDVLQLTGIFSAAWKLGVFGLLLVQMYRMAWQPFFLQRHKDPDAADLFGKILRYLCQFIGYASITLMVFLDKLVSLPILGRPIIDSAYWVGLEIVPGVLLAYAFQAWFIHFTLGIYIAKQTRYLMWSNGVGAAVTVAGNLLLIPYLGLWGATLSAILCYIVMAIMVMRKSQKLFPITVGWPKMIPILIWLSLGWILGVLVQKYPNNFPGLVRVGALAIFYIIPLLTGSLPIRGLLQMLEKKSNPKDKNFSGTGRRT
jgi:O-antigen/teichoic acid export membrane protein